MSHHPKRPTDASPSSSSAPPKKRRVSRACDTCRGAKDKCDGVKPQCQRCISLRRQCTYLSPGKRRGIPTGYLRAVELALAFLLDSAPECEGVLLGALAEPGGGITEAFLDKDSPAADALLDRWHRSEASKAIHRLISSDEGTPRADATEGDSVGPIPRSIHSSAGGPRGRWETSRWGHNAAAQQQQPSIPELRRDETGASLLKIPPNFQHYLNIYFTHTHSWLPIVDEEELLRLSGSYPPNGLAVNIKDESCASHSSLWSAMAVGAAMDAHQQSSPDGELVGTNRAADAAPEIQIYATARKLIPPEDGKLSEPHVRSLVLLSLVKLVQNEAKVAWLLIGQATRLLLQLTNDHGRHDGAIRGEHSVVLMACFIFDTLVSLALEIPSQMGSFDLTGSFDHLNALEGRPGLTRSPHDHNMSSPGTAPSPVASLFQQYKFARVLGRHLSRTAREQNPSGTGAAELVESLDPAFHFCNTLVHGGLNPEAPGAVLVHAGFLTASVLLSPTPAPRLIQSLVDVLGHYVSCTGSYASPPLLSIYLELATSNGRMAYLGPDDRQRTAGILQALKGQRGNPATTLSPQSSGLHRSQMVSRMSSQGLSPERAQQSPAQRNPGHLRTRAYSNSLPSNSLDTNQGYDAFAAPNLLPPVPNSSAGPSAPLIPMLGNGFSNDTPAMIPPVMPEGYPMDYDAILDELSSLDYADSNEPDPQFLMNLGFVPGCELNDMFGGPFGLL